MPRRRISTTVDDELLTSARSLSGAVTDAWLVDQALAALIAQYRSAEIDRSYNAYDDHPFDEVDEWGDLASFCSGVAAS